MENSVTVNEAIRRGKRIITYPSIFMFFGPLLFSIYLGAAYDDLNVFYIVFIFSLILPFAYKFFTITRWKIWAYENVRNVHQLRQKAYEEGLTFSQDDINFFEFRSASQKEKLERLNQKFLQEDIFQDDVSLPKEMIIHFSILKAVFGIVIWGSALCFGIYFYHKDVKAILIIVLGIYLVFLKFKNLLNREPQILLSNKGIQLQSEQLFNWENIEDEKLVVERNYGRIKRRKKYLFFSSENANQQILIDPLDISFDNLENALQVYRVRYEKEHLS